MLALTSRRLYLCELCLIFLAHTATSYARCRHLVKRTLWTTQYLYRTVDYLQTTTLVSVAEQWGDRATWGGLFTRQGLRESGRPQEDKAFLADRTATQCDRLLASSCRPSVCLWDCDAVHCDSQGWLHTVRNTELITLIFTVVTQDRGITAHNQNHGESHGGLE